METMEEKKVMSDCAAGVWSGSLFLFLCSCSREEDLTALFRDPEKRFAVFKAVKLTLSDAAGGLEGYEILKLHDAQPSLGIQIKFMDEGVCRKFLQSYASGLVQQFFGQHLSRTLSGLKEPTFETQLKAGSETLDNCLPDVDLCLHHVNRAQPDRLQDEEVSELEQQLQSLVLGDREPPSSAQPLVSVGGDTQLPSNSFLFQNRMFGDRQLTTADQQGFATHIGKDWKKVGRSLQRSCKALKGSAIDNLAYEYERDGLYEQAYQLLSKFIQAEGKAAKLSRLIRALEENKLIGIAEILLDVQPQE
ncbi:tumor necrosis factor receptor type 1-associated DEATH domain protein [Lepisosteus oculatus]|uniref:tumor necrosis factor receptor type 1-associated DEATH domain protein n=1 Tax=Lepisosteus oculatus TaxID=7918 RepID=UPI0035F521F3